ncbi:MAG: hypothetical protein K9H61_00740 [Bacteroidia bacterium]|nr:hypothetical protein [Bacteroidia bacterium]MCF8445492.1 hypothetical protein [Bacteroidia bacterium]
MKKSIFILPLILILFSFKTSAQRCLGIENRTDCNFEAVQVEYSVIDWVNETTNTYYYPDPIRGFGILSGQTKYFPTSEELIERWELDPGHNYEMTVTGVWVWDIYGINKINYLPAPGGVMTGPISTICCPTGIYTSYRHIINSSTGDFILVITCGSPVGGEQ